MIQQLCHYNRLHDIVYILIRRTGFRDEKVLCKSSFSLEGQCSTILDHWKLNNEMWTQFPIRLPVRLVTLSSFK